MTSHNLMVRPTAALALNAWLGAVEGLDRNCDLALRTIALGALNGCSRCAHQCPLFPAGGFCSQVIAVVGQVHEAWIGVHVAAIWPAAFDIRVGDLARTQGWTCIAEIKRVGVVVDGAVQQGQRGIHFWVEEDASIVVAGHGDIGQV